MEKSKILDEENHNCKTIRGKAYHVMRDRNNNWFCCFCNQRVNKNQLAKKWHAKFEEGRR